MAQPGTTFTTTDPALWIVTSLTAGSSHIVTATSRLETILRANRVPFKAVDISTDNKARMVWGRRAGKDANGRLRKLPGLVQQGVVLGDLVEIEEWNEYGELKEKVKIYFDDYTIPTKTEAEKMPALRAMTRPPGGAKPTSVPAATAKPAPTSAAAASVANAMATAASIAAKHAQMKEKELSKVAEIKKEDPPARSIADEAADKAKALRLQNLRKQVAESKKKDDEVAAAAAAAAAAEEEEKEKDKETTGEAEPKTTNEKAELDTTEDASDNVETVAKADTSSIETKDEPSDETKLQDKDEKASTNLETHPVKVVLVTPPPEEGSVPQEVVKADESKADSESESGTADATKNIQADAESEVEGELHEDEDDSDSGSEISDSDYDSDASQQREVDDMLPEEYDRLRQALQEPAKWSSPLENDARSIAETMDLSDDDAPRSISESLARLSRSNSAMSLRERVRADKERETFEMEREWQKLVLVGKAKDLDRANSLSGGPDSPALSLAAGMRSPSGLSAKDGPVSPVSSKTPGTPTVLVDSKTRSRDKHSLAVESRKDRAMGKTSSRSQHKSRDEKRDKEKTKSSSSTGGASKSKSVSKPKTKSARDNKDKEKEKEKKPRSADKDREAAKKKKSSSSSKDKDKEKEKEKKIDKTKSSASVAEKTPKSP
ncbi:hypothetical protein CFO_g2962 [Ceratocystis platani]|uniref:Uncharacterized protein n=1 Tax=Ceratocystis fimbriata f. sp. platani TaxID=88771 RepID=A0A0F8CVF0_CERFI|nr:hypothetical protein CFO_g2962 [Ceratocystis platani]